MTVKTEETKDIEKEFIKKYHIVKLWDKRYYEIIMPDRTYALEYTNPVLLQLPDGTQIAENTWKHMYLSLCEWAISKGVTREQFLNIRYTGRLAEDTHPFNDCESQKMMGLLSNGIYAIANWPAQLTFMAIQDFLTSLGYSLKDCHMLIFKPSYAEPADVREFYQDRMIRKFNSWLLRRTSMTTATNIIRLLKDESFLLKQEVPSQISFFLVQTRFKFAQIKSKYLSRAEAEYVTNHKRWNAIRKSLDLLTEFYTSELPAK